MGPRPVLDQVRSQRTALSGVPHAGLTIRQCAVAGGEARSRGETIRACFCSTPLSVEFSDGTPRAVLIVGPEQHETQFALLAALEKLHPSVEELVLRGRTSRKLAYTRPYRGPSNW
jgi:hypothetical protein